MAKKSPTSSSYQAFRDMFADEDVRNLEAYPVEEDEINELKNDIPLGTFLSYSRVSND